MKRNLLTPSRTVLAMLSGLIMTAGIVVSTARADEWDKRTILTVKNQPIQIRDTVLEPGQYVLRLLDSQSDRHIVQIFNSDQTHIINTVLAISAERIVPTGRTQFTFWETPPGTARAMRTWYFPGDLIGNEFPYPKHLQQIAMAEPAPNLAPAPEPVPVEATPAPEPAPAEPAPAELAPEPQTPAQTQPEEPASPPAPADQQTPPTQQLPQTGSSYPLIGLSGAMLLSLFGVLRFKRSA
jgi:LPXTG-motif cell wall-anchored protein